MTTPYFEADKKGLAKLLGARGKQFCITELVQNAWDEDVHEVTIELEPVPGRAAVVLSVEDDSPEGFADLSHTYTLFAESNKKANPHQRGRFNLGEKLVLAICTHAEIASTTGTVVFNSDGRRVYPRRKRESGSRFSGEIPMTRAELATMEETLDRLIPPEGVRTTLNGVELQRRSAVRTVSATLPTVLADSEGQLRPTQRAVNVNIYEPFDGETGWLYELGIPVVETGDRFDVEVSQKVPLNMDRDNVPPSYLRRIRTIVLNAMYAELDEETASHGWVGQALEDADVEAEAVRAVVTQRFGKKAVSFDPSDPEANKLATASGYTVVSGGSFNKRQWEAIRGAQAIKPAGQVTPSAKPYSDDPDAPVRDELPREHWTEGMEHIVAFTEVICERLTGVRPRVMLINDRSVNALAIYGSGKHPTFEYNVARLHRPWFDQAPASEPVLDIILHETGHHYSGDHLSTDYYHALTKLGAKLTRLALDEPELFETS